MLESINSLKFPPTPSFGARNVVNAADAVSMERGSSEERGKFNYAPREKAANSHLLYTR